MVKGKYSLPNLNKKHLVILSILFLFTSFPIGSSEPIDINPLSNLKSTNSELPNVYSVHLYEEISVKHNQVSKSDSLSSDVPPSKVFKIHLYDAINVSMSDNEIGSKILSVKGNSELNAIMERIFEKQKLSRISNIFHQNNGLKLIQLGSENGETEDLTEFNFPDIATMGEPRLAIFQAPASYSITQIEHILESENGLTEINKILTESGSMVIIDQNSLLILLLPLTALIFIRSENERFEFYNFRRVFCFVFITILLSSGVITPLSISSSYWPPFHTQKG